MSGSFAIDVMNMLTLLLVFYFTIANELHELLPDISITQG
jgi:hypothetical protein